MPIAYLGWGSNVGHRVQHLVRGVEILRSFGVDFLDFSPVYETEPVCFHPDDREQPWVLNMVTRVETDHTPLSLFLLGKETESRVGRQTEGERYERNVRRYSPRELDVDLLIYEDEILDHPKVQLPHPRFHTRRYDLKPFSDLAPDLVHPVLKKTIADLLATCDHGPAVEWFSSSLDDALAASKT